MLSFVKKISHFLSFFVLFIVFTSFISNAFASPDPYDGVRDVSWDASRQMCDAKDLEFDPFSPGNKDITWEYDNGVCIAYMAAVGITLGGAEYFSSSSCGYSENVVAVSAQMAMNVVLSPMTIVRRIQETNRCLFMSHTFPTCCLSTLGSTIAMGVAIGQLGTIHTTAQSAYETARICGRNWYDWAKINEQGQEHVLGEKRSRGAYAKSYKKCLKELFTNEGGVNSCGINPVNNSYALSNKYFREYLYGGIEYKDQGEGACKNPWNADKRKQYLGYSDDEQVYYMTGSGIASNYACSRFLASDQTDTDAQRAYDCCIKRSQTTICIEGKEIFDGKAYSDYEHVFCELGSRCHVGSVWYDAYQSRSGKYICAKTYSVCPYNHPLGGGTEDRSYDGDHELKNFCQVLNHCVAIPNKPYVRFSNLNGAFISSACKDLKGDTQNVYNYDKNILGSSRNFSAPMAQCFKETMQNMFLNRAGHTKCLDESELPDDDGQCASGQYQFKEGVDLDESQYPSFFLKIRSNLQFIIQIALSFSVMAMGFTVLLGLSPLNKKQLLSYLVKIALVMYFAVGNGWQHGFVDGVLNSSGELSELVFKIDESMPEDELDGCQFPRFNYADNNPATMYDEPAYPEGKEYLRIWDTLDCKLGRAIGYGPEVSVPNLALMIVGGFMTGGLGIVFLIASVSMAFFLFAIILRALHIFILSVTAIIILLYVSPITITLAMFGRTKGIFQGWWKQILGYILQPVILFAYLAVFITFFDKVMIGGARFEAPINGEPKKMICTGEAKDSSLYCIFRVTEVKQYTGLEIIGIGIPILQDMNKAKLNTILKAAFMLFIFLSFLDKITKFSKDLVGGGLSSEWKTSFTQFAGKGYKLASGLQKRRDRAALNALKFGYRKTKDAVRSASRDEKAQKFFQSESNKSGPWWKR